MRVRARAGAIATRPAGQSLDHDRARVVAGPAHQRHKRIGGIGRHALLLKKVAQHKPELAAGAVQANFHGIR